MASTKKYTNILIKIYLLIIQINPRKLPVTETAVRLRKWTAEEIVGNSSTLSQHTYCHSDFTSKMCLTVW